MAAQLPDLALFDVIQGRRAYRANEVIQDLEFERGVGETMTVPRVSK